MRASLLVELQTEELPPRTLQALSQAFATGIEQGLRARHFLADDSRATSFGTPRRIAVLITQVARRSDDRPLKEKLMSVAVARDAARNWTQAFVKKLEKMGRHQLARLPIGQSEGSDSLVVESDGKAEAVFLHGVEPGQGLQVVLQSVLDEAIAALPISKVMNYQLADGVTTVRFVRPAHRLVVLQGHEVVPVHALGLQAGTKTHGHRFMAPGDLAVHSADTYEEQLRDEGRVIASFAKRRASIVQAVNDAAARLGATALAPDDLLDEVCALVEWPVVIESGFEREFLEVPEECLVLTMQQNQKYFALRDSAGRLMNRFLLISQVEPRDTSAIVSGNARVIRARLADARFFYDQDRKQTLEARIPGLASVIYHAKLGSQLERVARMTGIAVAIARELGLDAVLVERAAHLAKADLRTLMVGEFPELQGIMGAYYAQHDGERAEVVQAIREHYRPRHSGDALPESKSGLCLALADKLETLVGLFGIGERPTGEKDPYALRRHALGVLRMLMERRLALPLDRLLAIGVEAFASVTAFTDARSELAEFFYDRLRGLLRDQGASANEIEAVVAARPVRIDTVPAQLAAVRVFMALPEAESLAAANKRIGNILKKADEVPQRYAQDLLVEPAERALGAAFRAVQPAAEAYFVSGDYTRMLTSLVPLKEPVDRFFEDVMVNVDDVALRSNRLGLLAVMHVTMNRVADLSKLTTGG
jgi:glycyl-tRNA synthetase beta chain